MCQMIYEFHMIPTSVQDAEEHQLCILDADYSAVNMEYYVHGITHLNSDEKLQLLRVGGGLGKRERESNVVDNYTDPDHTNNCYIHESGFSWCALA